MFSGPRLLALSAYWVAINYLWQGMAALILPRLTLGTVPAAHRGIALRTARTLLLILVGSLLWVYLLGALSGATLGMLLSVDWAFVAGLVPAQAAGRFIGSPRWPRPGPGSWPR